MVQVNGKQLNQGSLELFKAYMFGHGIRPPKGEVYLPVEGANGELGFYVVSDGSENAYRVRVRDDEHETRALAILSKHAAEDVHVHDIPKALKPEPSPIEGIEIDPFLPGARI